MNKVIRDGKVAVIYSPGYGAGWSSWNQDYPDLLFDPNIIEFIETKLDTPDVDESVIDEFINAYLKPTYPSAYFGGIDDLTIAWLPEGTEFIIHEYDGHETIKPKDSFKFIIA